MSASELMDNGMWDEFCEGRGINVWAVNEGLMDSDKEFVLTKEETQHFGFKIILD